MWFAYALFAVGFWYVIAPESLTLHMVEWIGVLGALGVLRFIGVGRSY